VPIRVTPEQAARFLRTPKATRRGKPKPPRSSESMVLHERTHPEDCEPRLAFEGCDNHHLTHAVHCPTCGLESKHLVQLRGLTGPLSVTLPECLACATLRRNGTLRRPRR